MRMVWIRMKRKPWFSLAIILFSVVISIALCGLHRGSEMALEEYDTICAQIRIRCTVTNLTGDQSDRLGIYSGILSMFIGSEEYDSIVLGDLLEDIQVKGSTEILWEEEKYTLVGITSMDVESRLRPENGCTIFWNDGADRSLFSTDKASCIISQSLVKKMEKKELPTDIFSFRILADNPDIEIENAIYIHLEEDYEGDLSIAGTYSSSSSTEEVIYCPWDTYVSILNTMNRYIMADSLYGTLRNNDELELFRETASRYFAEPNPKNAGKMVDGDFYLAMDINDSQLVRAKKNLENSLTVNEIATVLVFVLATAAGAFVGFLVIRSRKRDISLMRTLGTSNGRIYASFAAEQMLCVILGAVAGGVAFRWNPLSWQLLFVCVYFIGLSAALVMLLRKNLLTIIKEDE